jgi:hypothetical protein
VKPARRSIAAIESNGKWFANHFPWLDIRPRRLNLDFKRKWPRNLFTPGKPRRYCLGIEEFGCGDFYQSLGHGFVDLSSPDSADRRDAKKSMQPAVPLAAPSNPYR